VTELQLQQLETLYQKSRDSRQTSLQQLNVLQTKAQTLQSKAEQLQQESVKLQERLQMERTTTQLLSNSVSKLEGNLQTQQEQAAVMQQKYNDEKLACQKTKNQRNILFFVALGLVVVIGGYVFLKISKIILW
jgi:hypothetical protein